MKRALIALVVVVAAAAAALWLASDEHVRATAADSDEPMGGDDPPARTIVAGGGDAPESNEISIEEDMLLATALLPQPTTVLYAAGPKTRAVRVADASPPPDTLRQRLGMIFNPRTGRSSRYQPTRLPADGPATPSELLAALKLAATADSGEPLTVYLAGHGGPGQTAAENTFALWGARSLRPSDLAQTFAENPPARDVRIVMTTCFSGGFAEAAFDGDALVVGDSPAGEVCGLFASTWDREAGGCDPNPERGQHDGYGVHFLNALAGRDREGDAVPPTSPSGGKTTTLLDAHTSARLRSGSIDVPTTTSEWHLRNVVAGDVAAGADPGLLPHEDLVVSRLGDRLKLADEAATNRRLKELLSAVETARAAETLAAEAEADAYYEVAGELLARWPLLDDPWHPRWQATVDAERAAIRGHLDKSAAVAGLDAAMKNTNRISNERAELEVRVAPVLRLARAYENRRLAAALRRAGGRDWSRFQRLRTCEDSAP